MSPTTTKLTVKIVPGSSSEGIAGWLGASRDEIRGWLGDSLRVRVTAPPERGKANDSVVRLLEDALSLERGSVRILKGKTSPRKLLEITGISESELRKKLPP